MLLFIQFVVYDLLSFPFALNFGAFPFGKSFLHAWFRFSWVFERERESTSQRSTSERKGCSFFRWAGVVLRSFPLLIFSYPILSPRRWFQTKRQQPKVFQMRIFCSMVGFILNSMHLETMMVSALSSVIILSLRADVFLQYLKRCPSRRYQTVAPRPEVFLPQLLPYFRKILLHQPG